MNGRARFARIEATGFSKNCTSSEEEPAESPAVRLNLGYMSSLAASFEASADLTLASAEATSGLMLRRSLPRPALTSGTFSPSSVSAVTTSAVGTLLRSMFIADMLFL